VGTRNIQELLHIKKDMHGDIQERNLGAVRLVPLMGDEGWKNG
jgi:protein-L-isoaspartate O-methyltransferase